MPKDIRVNGVIHRFPDEATPEQINLALGGKPQEKLLLNSEPYYASQLMKIPNLEKPGIFSNLFHGFSEGYPRAIKGDINAIAELANRHPFELPEEQPAESLSEKIGRFLGKTGGHITAAAPGIALSEAMIPGMAGLMLGSGVTGALTQSGGPRDRVVTGLIDSIIPAALKGTGSAAKLGISAIRRSPKPRQAADILQSSHKAMKEYATSPLEEAKKLISERGLSNFPMEDNIFIEAEKALPKTRSMKSLIDKAKSGEYESLDKLQSDLGKKAVDLSHSDLSAERSYSEEVKDLKDRILEGIHGHLKSLGQEDISKLISEGKNRYANFADLYLSNPTVSKLVGKEKIVPKNLISTLSGDSAYLTKLRKEIPKINKITKIQEEKEKLKFIGKVLGTGGVTAAIIKHLFPTNSDHGER